MDLVGALERGELPPVEEALSRDVFRSSEVARLWAVELRLRPGNTLGPPPVDLVPVVEVWAAARGMTGPGHRDLGRGLAAAGCMARRMAGQGRLMHVLLHREDAARLWRMVREVWGGPGRSPGDRHVIRRRGRAGLKRRLGTRHAPPTPLSTWADELALLPRGGTHRPIVDSMGRVWPAPSVAARVLGGSPKALGNAMAALRALATGQSQPPNPGAVEGLRRALVRRATWKGLLWRYLTPEELAAIQPTHPAGTALPGLGWGLACHWCKASAIDGVAAKADAYTDGSGI